MFTNFPSPYLTYHLVFLQKLTTANRGLNELHQPVSEITDFSEFECCWKYNAIQNSTEMLHITCLMQNMNGNH